MNTCKNASAAAPIFLVGTLRSGTTLLTLMLDHHPEIAWCHEFEYVTHFLKEPNVWPNVDVYSRWLRSHLLFSLEEFAVDTSLSYVDLANSFLEQKKIRNKKRIIGATVHHNFEKILYIWPNARFIHVFRDPRDVAYSCIRKKWSGNFWAASEWWITAEKTWDELEKGLPKEQTLNIKYELLVTDFDKVIKEICDFVGVIYDKRMLNYVNSTEYDLPDPNELEKWRDLEASQVQLIESRVGSLLADRGYEHSGLKTLELNYIQKLAYKWHDRFQRRKYKFDRAIARYGWQLILQYLIFRTFRKNKAENIKQRMNLIDAQYLRWSDRAYTKGNSAQT